MKQYLLAALTILCGVVRMITEYSFPIWVFYLLPLKVAFLCLFLWIFWQVFTFTYLVKQVRKQNQELSNVKSHIKEIARSYTEATEFNDQDAHRFFRTILKWNKTLNAPWRDRF